MTLRSPDSGPAAATGLVVRLRGRPCLVETGAQPYRMRSRKSWALLAYLLLTERPTSRGRLAELLFAEADDPLRALRWSRAEIRRALGEHGSIEGDPVVLTLGDDVPVDALVLLHGSWPLGSYPQALDLLERAVREARETDDPRREAYALSMRGRVDLLCGRLDDASARLAESVALAERGHWLSFLPWPEALQGELHLARQEPEVAAQALERAFARACQLGDPCWEGMAARELAARTGMRELTVRALLHSAALGDAGDAAAAELLAADVDNEVLHALVRVG